jgi:hypothetical protein
VERKVRVEKLGGSFDGPQLLDKISYRVSISEGGKNVVIAARISLGTHATLSEPEKCIEEWFAKRPLPKANTVIDLGDEFAAWCEDAERTTPRKQTQ